MNELLNLLNNVTDSYDGFVGGIMAYAHKKQSRIDAISKYIKNNPQATSSDIIYFVSKQDDFFDDDNRHEHNVEHDKYMSVI